VRGTGDFKESLLQFLLVPGGHATEHIAGSGGGEGVQHGWMALEYVADLVQRALRDLKRHEGLDGVARGLDSDEVMFYVGGDDEARKGGAPRKAPSRSAPAFGSTSRPNSASS
jgi:hypothetical protein